MGYNVKLSSSAIRDLRDIVRYISFDAPDRALTFGRFLVAQTKRLSEFPEMGRVVPEFGQIEIREIVVQSYRVIYQVDHKNERVDVLRFWHGRRGAPALYQS